MAVSKKPGNPPPAYKKRVVGVLVLALSAYFAPSLVAWGPLIEKMVCDSPLLDSLKIGAIACSTLTF